MSDCPTDVAPARICQPQSLLLNLPVELQKDVIDRCDLEAHIKLRQTCRQLRLLATEQRAFRHIVQFGLATLNTMFTSDVAHRFTANQLWAVMQTPWCQVPDCGESWLPQTEQPQPTQAVQPQQPQFAPHLFLPTLTRCCMRCMTDERRVEFDVCNARRLAKVAGVTVATIRMAMTHMRNQRKLRPLRVPLSVSMNTEPIMQAEEARAVLKSAGVMIDSKDTTLFSDVRKRHLAYTSVPYIRQVSRNQFKAEAVMCCKACQMFGNTIERGQAFTMEGAQEHVRHCRQVAQFLQQIETTVRSGSEVDFEMELGWISEHEFA